MDWSKAWGRCKGWGGWLLQRAVFGALLYWAVYLHDAAAANLFYFASWFSACVFAVAVCMSVPTRQKGVPMVPLVLAGVYNGTVVGLLVTNGWWWTMVPWLVIAFATFVAHVQQVEGEKKRVALAGAKIALKTVAERLEPTYYVLHPVHGYTEAHVQPSRYGVRRGQEPIYFTRHPDGTYSVATPQPKLDLGWAAEPDEGEQRAA